MKNPVLAWVLAIGQIERYAPANPHEIWLLYPAPQKKCGTIVNSNMRIGRIFHKRTSLNPSLGDPKKHLVDMLTDLAIKSGRREIDAFALCELCCNIRYAIQTVEAPDLPTRISAVALKYTRIDVRHVLGLLATGRTIEEVANCYQIPIEAVKEALILASHALDKVI